MKSWYSIRAAAKGAPPEVLIYDEIGFWGITAKEFIADLKAVGDAKELTLRVNSPGGDVFDGWAIYNALRRHPARVTAYVDGIAASMASVILMAADEVVMPENAMLLVHNPTAIVLGDAEDMRGMAAALDKMTDSIVGAYVQASGADEADVRQLVSDETWLSAAEAVDLGFADRIIEPVKMAACYGRDKIKAKKLPPQVAAMFEQQQQKEISMPRNSKSEPRSPAAPAAPEPQQSGDDVTNAPAEPVAPPADPVPVEPEAPAAPVDPDPSTEREVPPQVPGAPAQPDPASITAKAARAEALAYAGEVCQLCSLAGMAERAAGYIASETSCSDVRRELMTARAERDEASAIDGARPGKRPGASVWDSVLKQ